MKRKKVDSSKQIISKFTLDPLMSGKYIDYEPDIKLSDYDSVVESVRSPPEGADVVANTYLQDQIPINQSESLMGVTDLPPSDFEKIMFLRKHFIINHPESLYDMLNSGRISLLELMILESVYPKFIDEVKMVATEALISKKEKQEELSLKSEYVLMGLFKTINLRQDIFENEEESDSSTIESDTAEQTKTDIEKALS